MSTVPHSEWHRANHRYLAQEMARLRLLLRRRVLWLRAPGGAAAGLAAPERETERLLAGEDRAAEMEFYRTDPQARRVDAELAAVEGQLVDHLAQWRGAEMPLATDALVHLLGLSGFERNLLLLCMAAEIDPAFERLFAYVQDDETRGFPTPHLAIALLTGPAEEAADAWHSFQPHATFARFCLLPPDDCCAAASQPLRLAPRIAAFVRGFNAMDERLVPLLRPLEQALLPPRLEALADRLERWMVQERSRGLWPRLNLVGPPGAGKRALAQAVAARLGLDAREVDVRRLGERLDLAAALEREALLLGFALFVDATEVDRSAAEPGLGPEVADALDRLRLPLVVGSRQGWPARGPMLAMPLAPPDAEEREGMWRQALEAVPHSVNGQLANLVEQFSFGPSHIPAVVEQARANARLRTAAESDVSADDLWLACRDRAGLGMEGLAQRIVPCHGWDDIVVPDDVLRQLREISGQMAQAHTVYTRWGFGARLSRGRGASALFAGPSGTGKTLAAEILARSLSLELYRVDLSGVVSKYIGETEKNLRRVFDAADRGGAILFFDEADALFGKRSEVKESHDRYANIEIDYLLQRMEEYRGLAILATNLKSHLDHAFLRRLRFVVHFPFPDAEHRRRIWEKGFPAGAPTEGLRHDELARLELSGGNIRNIILCGAFLAAGEGEPIRMEHLMRAAAREYGKEERLVGPADFGAYYPLART